MSDNWVVQNLENALETWNRKLTEIWIIITQDPQTFKGGLIWQIILKIYGTMQAIGYALLVLFFVVGILKTCTSWEDVKRPSKLLKLFLRFVLSKAVITYGMDLLLSLMSIGSEIIAQIMQSSGVIPNLASALPQALVTTIENCGFWESIPLWAVTLIGSLFITVLSFVMILTVYGRYFKIYMYAAIAPIPLAAFAGEPTQNIGKQFLKSFCCVLLEGAVIVLACIIFSVFASSQPAVNTGVSAVNAVWRYVGELIFNMLVLTGAVKMADRVVKEMMGM